MYTLLLVLASPASTLTSLMTLWTRCPSWWVPLSTDCPSWKVSFPTDCPLCMLVADADWLPLPEVVHSVGWPFCLVHSLFRLEGTWNCVFYKSYELALKYQHLHMSSLSASAENLRASLDKFAKPILQRARLIVSKQRPLANVWNTIIVLVKLYCYWKLLTLQKYYRVYRQNKFIAMDLFDDLPEPGVYYYNSIRCNARCVWAIISQLPWQYATLLLLLLKFTKSYISGTSSFIGAYKTYMQS